MELNLIIALALAFGIGLSLGLLGSGGSIVTLPVLVYVAGVPATSAVGMSLAIVGGTSAAGVWWKHRQGLVHWRAAAWFGGRRDGWIAGRSAIDASGVARSPDADFRRT